MDNKQQQNFSRQANSKACQPIESSRKSADIQSKTWQRNSRRRENSNTTKNDQKRSSKQQSTAVVRQNVDKRPRPRGSDGAPSRATSTANDILAAAGAGLDEDAAHGYNTAGRFNQGLKQELHSVYSPGSKKQSLNHLLNFHYAPRESDYLIGAHAFGRSATVGSRGAGKTKPQKYNKEQFMQANFQFVIKSSAKPQPSTSPDTLINWDLIEQINIQTTEEPQCPICLYPPVAAKLTRCGHAYCWSCILHYLSLSDKTWRKCPICYDAIHVSDLKSTTIVQQLPVMVGDLISFHLMRRKKGSMLIERYQSSAAPPQEQYPLVSSSDNDSKLFSKFLIAKRRDILDIIEREKRELMMDEDMTCPEAVFKQQALNLLEERREKLSASDSKETDESTVKNSNEIRQNECAVTVVADVKNAALPPRDSTSSTEMDASGYSPQIESANFLSPTKYYYFYQSVDGQNIYLHPLNVKMLQACYGSLDKAPVFIEARVLQKEYYSMDEEHRRKFTCLAHLPLTCQYAVVEVDLQPPLVAESILKLFKDDLLNRKKERQRRDREERRRERKIDEINDRQIGKIITSTANINFNSAHEFPTCGFEDTLVSSNEGAISTRHATYSSVAVVGGEYPSLDFWSTSSSSPKSNNRYQPLSTWGRPTTATPARRNFSDRCSESESVNEVILGSDSDAIVISSPTRTNLGEVLAEALSQKKHGAAEKNERLNMDGANGHKKNKKSKKMQPLFSTGMNFSGK